MRYLRLVLLGLLALAAGGLVAGGRAGDAPAASAATTPVVFHCSLDASCPEVMIAGDPFATLGGAAAPFRGYGDPSLERDPSTGTLWLSYSWLDVLVSDPGPPPKIDFGVRTHLARSDDGGASFTFVKAVNEATALTHPDSGANGWAIHEVSTLLREGAGAWQILWLTYFDPFGEPPAGSPDDRSDFYYARSAAVSPGGLGDVSEPWIRGAGTSPSFGAQHDLSTIPELSDCVGFTEPALFSQGGVTYLATNCVVILGGVRRDDLERLVLLRQEAVGYSYIGTLLDSSDALDLGATRFEQADLALSQSGAVLLIGTPILTGDIPVHLGCVVFQVTDIDTAQVLRDGAGDAIQLARITGDDSSIGSGLCTYDAASQTGLLMVLHIMNADPFDLVFSLRATGIHPDVNCPAAGTPWPTPVGDGDCDGFADTEEAFVATDPVDACPDNLNDDAWPADMASMTGFGTHDGTVNILDIVQLTPPVFNTAPPNPNYNARKDLNGDGTINILDIVRVTPPTFNQVCV